jgi:hypothetical protein
MQRDGPWNLKTILVAAVVTVVYAFTVSFIWIALTDPGAAEPTRADDPSRPPADVVSARGER